MSHKTVLQFCEWDMGEERDYHMGYLWTLLYIELFLSCSLNLKLGINRTVFFPQLPEESIGETSVIWKEFLKSHSLNSFLFKDKRTQV